MKNELRMHNSRLLAVTLAFALCAGGCGSISGSATSSEVSNSSSTQSLSTADASDRKGILKKPEVNQESQQMNPLSRDELKEFQEKDGVYVRQDMDVTIKFSWWGNDVRHEYTMDALTLFEEENPDILVTHMYGVWDGYEKRYDIYMKSGNTADVMQINYNWLNKYSADGEGYYDLYELADYIDLSGFSEEDLEVGTQNGKLNALPIAYNMTTFFYNKDIYDSYGLDIPETWDDLFEAAEVMSVDGIYPMGMAQKHLFQCLIAWYEQTTGDRVFDEDGNFYLSADGAAKIFEFYKELRDKNVIPQIDDFSADSFFSGKTAGASCWASDENRYCGPLVGEGTNVVLGNYLSTGKDQSYGWYRKPATLYAIAADTMHPAEAAILIDFLLNSEEMAKLQGTEKGIPVSASAREVVIQDEETDQLAVAANQQMTDHAENIKTMPSIMEDSDIIAAFKEIGDEYIYGITELETCAEQFVQQVRKMM